MAKKCERCKAFLRLTDALEEVIAFYENDHDRSSYEFEDIPEELQQVEMILGEAYKGLRECKEKKSL